MGLPHVTVSLRVPGTTNGTYVALFLVDTGATDSMAPGSAFGLAQSEFMGEVTAGRVIFGPEGVAPILGATALESVGITIDPATRTLKRLPAVPLK